MAMQRINQDRPINYEGAGSSDDWTGIGENFPNLVRWEVQNGEFIELTGYRCDPENPICVPL